MNGLGMILQDGQQERQGFSQRSEERKPTGLLGITWFLLVFANCLTGSVPGQGNDWPWQAQSGPFLVCADGPVRHLDALAQELLELSERLQTELGVPLRIERIRLYLFHDREMYEQFLLQNVPHLTQRDVNRQGLFFVHGKTPVIVAAIGPDLRRTLRHEFVHAVLNPSLPGLPLWLDEGLAMYYEVPEGHGWQERLAEQLERQTRQGWQASLTRLERLTRMQQMGVLEYAEAWSWTFLLLRAGPQHRTCLQGFLADLQRGATVPPLSERWRTTGQTPEQAWSVFYGWQPPRRASPWNHLRQWLTQ
ncbi:MAG: hypothetical protein RMJ19_01215 [Gemmatales bacterium]|nr:DUF1570 domain-containing protein [Gemmatales bacterium]MDW8174266.1 hypothetical protein [Gemmatales bacterium]